MATNVIPFPAARAKNRDEIARIEDWQASIRDRIPAMSGIGKEMAAFLLERLDGNLHELRRA